MLFVLVLVEDAEEMGLRRGHFLPFEKSRKSY